MATPPAQVPHSGLAPLPVHGRGPPPQRAAALHRRKGTFVGNLVWTVLNTISKIGGRQVTSGFAGKAWKTATGRTPPENPMSPETTWGEAVAWAVLTGAISGLAVMLTTRLAAGFYTKSAGHLPKKLQAGQSS